MRRRWVELGRRWRNDAARDHGSGDADDGVGGDERDAEFYGDGEQRHCGEGCDVGGVVRDGGRVRSAVGDDGRFGSGGDVHGACCGAEPRDGDTDGDVGERWDEVGVGGDHDYIEWAATDGRGGDGFAEGDGAGGEPVAGADGDGDGGCWRGEASRCSSRAGTMC